MALNDFIQKTLGFQLLQPPKAYVDPALKQGARFNIMQGQIIASVIPELPLMSQTTGPNLGSIRETLDNMGSTQTALERLDKKEFKLFQQKQDEFNQLLSELALKEQTLDKMSNGVTDLQGLSSGNSITPAIAEQVQRDIFSRTAAQSNKYWTDIINNNKATGNANSEQSLNAQKILDLSQQYRQKLDCGVDVCLQPDDVKSQISRMNQKIMKKANEIVQLSRSINTIDEEVEKEMGVQKTQLHGQLQELRKFKEIRNKLSASQQTLMGELTDTRLELDSKYYQYLVWLIAAITLGALSFHRLTNK